MAEHHGVSTSSTMPPVQQRRGSSSHATRPVIKIIHIVAPEIIKTDVANFRDLVQRLTGKQPPTGAATSSSSSMNTSSPPLVEEENKRTAVEKRAPSAAPVMAAAERTDDVLVQQEPSGKKRKIKCEVKVEEGGFDSYGLDCNDLWMDLNPGGSFMSFLEEELDAFQGLSADHDFLQPPRMMDLVGEMYAS